MKHLIKLTIFFLLISVLTGCTAKTTVEDSAKTLTEAPSSTDVTSTKTPVPTEPISEYPVPAETQAPVATEAPKKESTRLSYPTMHADIPDLDIIRVGETYYMVSTTMNLCPGVPIMKSTDLGHWEIVNYVYDTFADDDVTNLENGRDMYAHGSWAASLKYNEADGLYYVAFNSNDHGFFIYTTDDIENGTWTKHTCRAGFHDPALFFEDGNLYVISAAGGNCSIRQLFLDSENGTVTTFGSSQKLFSASKDWSLWEGAHVYKVGDYYYIFIIASPSDRWMRTEVCYRSKDLFSTDWEEQIVFQGGCGGQTAGLAQGGIVQTQFGDWYGFLFQDRGAVGRVPSIVSVNWEDDWPYMGAYSMDGKFTKNQTGVVAIINLPASKTDNYFTDSDAFSYQPDDTLKKVWQWNHNPKNDYWSVTAREGCLRMTTDTVVDNIWYAHNSLTQRTYGYTCISEVKLYTDHLKPGDYAGLCAVADYAAMIGIHCDAEGNRYIFQADADFKSSFEAPNATVSEPLAPEQPVYLKIAYDFKKNTAEFFYSLDSETWTALGTIQNLGFSTSTTFMGTRSWLFTYATKEAGGYADFDYYLVYDSEKNRPSGY